MLSKSEKHQHLSLISQKDNGRLVYPSVVVVRILSIAKRIFQQFVSGIDREKLKGENGESRLHVRLDPVKFRFTVTFFEEVYSFKPDSFSCDSDVRYSILSFTTQSKCAVKCILRKIPVHD